MAVSNDQELSTFLQKFKNAIHLVAKENTFRDILNTFAPFNEFQERCYQESGSGSLYIGGKFVNEVGWETNEASFCCPVDRRTIPGDYIASLSLRFEREKVSLADLMNVFGDYRWDLDPVLVDQAYPVAYFSRQSLCPDSFASIAAVINKYNPNDPLLSWVEQLHLGYYDDRYDTSFPL